MSSIESIKRRVDALAPKAGTVEIPTPEQLKEHDDLLIKIFEAIKSETLSDEKVAELQRIIDGRPVGSMYERPRVPEIVFAVIANFLASGEGCTLRYKELEELCKRHGIGVE